MRRSIVCMAAFGIFSANAQSGLVGPSSGFLFDAPSKSVRLVRGSLGAATLGEPVLDLVDFASVSPAGNHAIGCRRGECFVVVNLSSSQLQTLPLTSTPEGVAWAPDGSGAVLYSRTGAWLQTLTGISGTPDVSQIWNVPNPGTLLAVAFDGGNTIIAVGGDSGGIFQVTPTGGLLRVADTQTAIALTAPKSNTVYALDAASPAILRIPLQGGPTDRWDLPLNDPVALQLGKDSAQHPTLYIGGGEDQAVIALDPQTGSIKERTDLSFRPSVLEPLPGGSFLLTSRTGSDSLLWSLVPSRGAYFIPAPPSTDDAPLKGRRR